MDMRSAFRGQKSASRGIYIQRSAEGSWADPSPQGLPTGGLLGEGQTPRDTWDTTGYGQQAGRTHPTGMLSCNDIIISLLTKPSFQSLKLGIRVTCMETYMF